MSGFPGFPRLPISPTTSCIQQQTLELGTILQALDLLDVLGGGKDWERPGWDPWNLLKDNPWLRKCDEENEDEDNR